MVARYVLYNAFKIVIVKTIHISDGKYTQNEVTVLMDTTSIVSNITWCTSAAENALLFHVKWQKKIYDVIREHRQTDRQTENLWKNCLKENKAYLATWNF